MPDLDGYDDVFDSRDVIERIEELRDEIGENTAPDDYVLERETLAELEAFQAQVEPNSEWVHGMTFIRDSYFTTYAEELAEDIGAIDPAATWPLNRIDWEAAADDLLIDYSEYEFRGFTYYTRD